MNAVYHYASLENQICTPSEGGTANTLTEVYQSTFTIRQRQLWLGMKSNIIQLYNYMSRTGEHTIHSLLINRSVRNDC